MERSKVMIFIVSSLIRCFEETLLGYFNEVSVRWSLFINEIYWILAQLFLNAAFTSDQPESQQFRLHNQQGLITFVRVE